MIGVGGPSFDDDDVIANNDDEDLRNDPISQIDLRVRPPGRYLPILPH
jgi:hypothetical protein